VAARAAKALKKENKIKRLEKWFIARSGSAFETARKQSQASGHSVVISDQGAIYEIFPDGNRRLLKQIEPPTRVRPGQKVIIR